VTLRQSVKVSAKKALAPLARLATRGSARVLMYHRFGPGDWARRLGAEELDRQLRYLRRHFSVVPLRQLIARLRAGQVPEPLMVAITVDDAYADFGQHAYPVFRRHGVPVTVYVVSEFAGGRFWLWWDAVRHLVAQAPSGQYELQFRSARVRMSLGDRASRDEAWSALAAIGVTLAPADRDGFLLDLQSALSLRLPTSPPPEFAGLSWDELCSLDPDIVEIGAHTRTHPILARCDEARIREEVAGSKFEIELRTGRQVSAFCYPNGERDDVDERCVAAVRQAGFESAVMAYGSMIGRNADRYRLERMGAPHTASEFDSDVSGVAYMRQSLLG
jgi:peptidoglycan/xylan/chitin deacetylase (PgdA/CDA1 family)